MATDLDAGVDLFNAAAFWHAHEAWEHVWRQSPEPRASLYKGLIQAAAALVHWQRGNRTGLVRNWEKARPRLVIARALAGGLDIAGFIAAMDRFVAAEGALVSPPRLQYTDALSAE